MLVGRDLITRSCSFVDELSSLMNEIEPEQILVLFQFYSSLYTHWILQGGPEMWATES